MWAPATGRWIMALRSAGRADDAVHGPRAPVGRGLRAVLRGIAESGVARDILKPGMATLIPADPPQDDCLGLDTAQCALIVRLYGVDGLRRRGLVD